MAVLRRLSGVKYLNLRPHARSPTLSTPTYLPANRQAEYLRRLSSPPDDREQSDGEDCWRASDRAVQFGEGATTIL